MGHFAWNAEHEVFIAQIDTEHRRLFDAAGAFEHAIETSAPLAELQHCLHALGVQIEEHFSHEEWLMQSVRYPSFAWHRQQHETARRRLKLFVPLIDQGNTDAIDALLDFLAGWLNDHTSVTDRMMASFVRNYERAHATGALERWGSPGLLRAVPAPAPREEAGPFPKTLHFCKTCGHQTAHEMRPGGLLCRNCAERSVGVELDRD